MERGRETQEQRKRETQGRIRNREGMEKEGKRRRRKKERRKEKKEEKERKERRRKGGMVGHGRRSPAAAGVGRS